MKQFKSVLLSVFVSICATAFADVVTNNTPTYSNAPIVSVTAIVPSASESGASGAFRIARNRAEGTSLAVWFSVSGTAENGVDYGPITNRPMLIPPGSNSVIVSVKAIDDSLVEGTETVVLRLEESPLLSPVIQYVIGTPSQAVVTIADNDVSSNRPPAVRIVSPTNNSVFPAPANITITAEAEDPDGTVTSVEFMAGNISIGKITVNPNTDPPQGPWQITWSNVPPGTYTLRARAIDNQGANGWSSLVTNVVVRGPEDPQPIVSVTKISDSHETGAIGRFRISRTGNTNVAFPVYFQLGGNAMNGLDYTFISNRVDLAAGQTSVEIMVNAVDDNVVEPTEVVTLTISPMACIAIYPPPPECYRVGSPSVATLSIYDNDTNLAPVVEIESPHNGSQFIVPATIPVTVRAADPDGSLKQIDLFSGNALVGTVETNSAAGERVTVIFTLNATVPGTNILKARAIDTRGATNFSGAVMVVFRGTNAPPETNLPIVTVFATDAFAIEGPGTNYWGSNVPPHIDGTNTIVTNWTTLRTNAWEPNTATFVVRRSGGTNSPLHVLYVLTGTASNGVDYVKLSNSITIPAGERSVRIMVTPIDDVLREGVETIVLRLSYSPLAVVPTYVLGKPAEAGAIIIDNDVPRPPTRALSDALFHLCKDATNGFVYRLEYSTNLLNWIPLQTNVVTEGAVQYVDPETTVTPNRFYRVVPELTMPID